MYKLLKQYAHAFGGTFAISHKPTRKPKIAKEPISQLTADRNDVAN